MGEETDGVVESVSKLQSKVKAISGVDILTDTGAYKDTYTIIKELAEVWDDIGKTDPKGQAALLELLAGKNRSNAIAAMLTNIEDLEGAYESALDAEGSAMAENEKQLNSIQGRITLFNNAVQTMWKNTLNSDAVKFFVNLGTSIVKVTDKVGLLKAAIAALATYKFGKYFIKQNLELTKQGASASDIWKKERESAFGLKNLTKKVSPEVAQDDAKVVAAKQAAAADNEKVTAAHNAANADNAKATAAQNFIDSMNNKTSQDASENIETDAAERVAQAKEKEINAAERAAQAKEEEANAAKRAAEADNAKVGAADNAAQADNAESVASRQSEQADNAEAVASRQSEQADIAEANASRQAEQADVAEAAASRQASSADSSQAGSSIGSSIAGSSAAGAALGGLKGLALGLLLSLAAAGIQKLIGWVDDLIHRQEILQEEVKDLTNTYKTSVDEINSSLSKLTTSNDSDKFKTLEDEFVSLSAGVDAFGNNIGLTSEQYERYKSICETIVGVNNKLIEGHNSATEAIGNNANALSALIEFQKEQARLQAEEYVNSENLPKIAENAKNDYDDAHSGGLTFPTPPVVSPPTDNTFTGWAKWLEDNPIPHDEFGAREWLEEQRAAWVEDYEDWYNNLLEDNDIAADTPIMKLPDDLKKQATDKLNYFASQYQSLILQVDRYIEELDAEELNGMRTAMSAVLTAMKGYSDAPQSVHKFMSDWVNESSDFMITGSFDPDKDPEKWKKQIKDFYQNLIDSANDPSTWQSLSFEGDSKFSAQQLLDKIYNFDPSSVSWEQYQEQMQELIAAFWKAMGVDDPTAEQRNFFGGIDVDFSTKNDDVTKWINVLSERLDVDADTIQERINRMPANKVEAFLQIDWNAVAPNSWQEVEAAINKQIPAAREVVGNTLSTYADTLEKFTNAQSIQNEVIYDNIKLTEDQGAALKELIGGEEDYADAVDESNGYVVKNIELVNRLIAKKKQEAVQNAKTEKSQARLKYYELYKKIRQLTGANGELAQANAKEINALYKEMGAVEQTIAKYSMLEQRLLGAANAYDKFEEAQTADQEKDYGSKAEEMISSLIEGLQSAKIGTETFRAAVLGMIPEEVYSNLDTVEEKVAAIANYLKNSDFSKYFTLTFGDDGTLESAEMKLDNVKAFIESSQEKGVFTNQGDWTHFELSDDIKTLDDFCEKMNLTKEMAFAMFTEIDSYDGEWLNGDFGTMLDQLDLGLEGNIFMATKTLTELDVSLANNKISVEEWAEKYQEANSKLQGCAQETRTNAVEYQNATTEVANYKKELEQATQKLSELNKPESGATQEEIQTQTDKVKQLTEQLGAALQKKYKLEEPTEMSIQLALDDIDSQMTVWKANNNELAVKANIANIDDSQLVELGEDGKYQIKPDVEITDDERQKLQQYIDLLNDQGTINLLVENQEEAKAQIEEVKTAAEAAKKAIEALPDPSVDSTAAVKSINKLIDAINLIPTGVTITTTYREINENQTATKTGGGKPGNSRYRNNSLQYSNGTAHASGSWGAETSDTSLVGELGPELRVRGNRWDMLGENGAEFADVKKGDIIFNHKQTKSLLENGYINSRGKAYASGTASSFGNIFDNLKLKKLAKYAEEMCEQYEELVNGNVDLRKRPHLSPSYEHDLAMSGGYNSFIGSDGQIYASTSAETVTIGTGDNQYTIDVTPVLENGEVLTSDALSDYIDSLVTNGSTQDLLNSDKYNLVIRAVPGEHNEEDWTGFEEELSQYKDGYLDTLLKMFNLGGENAIESRGFSSVGIAGVAKDLQGDDSYVGKEVASAIDSTADGMRNLDSLINQYVTDVLNAKSLADDIGTDLSQTKYGNVDTDNRQKLYWDDDSIDKYSDAIDSWGMKADDLVGTYSTLLSCVGEFGGADIAFTPILQTDSGPQLLDSDTVDKYIDGLISKASQDNGQWTNDELFRLDTEGLEVDGTVVKNLLEDIGENADKTARLLHYVGDTGAIASLEGEIESTSSELVATGENINAVQAKLDKLNATNISDKTFTVTTEYQTIGRGAEQTVHTPGASGRLTIYADGTAHVSGDWGLPRAENDALVGELGQETVVDPRTGKYYTVGDNGAEFVDLPKDAIIFNHKQTEELFKNGHINSRGKAYAEGNAHVTIVPDYTTPTYYSGAKNDNFWTDFNDAADSLSDAGDDLSDAANDFEEMFDWFAVLLEEIDDDLNYMSAALENAVGISAKNDIQDQMINVNKYKLTELGEGYKLYADYAAQLLEKIPQQYQELAKNGGVALTEFLGEANQEVVEAINNYREWAQKASDVRTQQQQVKKEITSLSLQKVQTIADEYDRVITKITTLNDLLQANVDLIDEQGERTSAVMYEEMIKNSIKELDELQKKRNDMQKEFDAQVSAGNIDVGSEEWYEGIAAIQDVDKAIIDCRKEIEGFQNSINQLHWDNFDGLIKAIDNVGNEISNLGDLIDDEDIADEMGNWTNEGITKMGLLAQEMERAQYRAKQYAEQIEYLNQEYAAGKYSTDEYNEKLQELKDGQLDSIKSYEAAKDAIVDLNRTRVDAAKDAMQKEIDAYNELIDKKKEELQLSKDAHDFSKQVAESQKNIATIEKQLAALAGDNSASAIARRKKLEAELAAAQEELDELYYNHSIEKQQDALDDQAENYQDEKEKEMEALDEYLKNVEQVIADSFATITGNTEAVAETLKGIADEYGIDLSEAIINPWEQGVIAIGTYQDQLNTSTSAFTAQLDLIKQQLLDLQAAADETARHLIDVTNQNVNKTSSATYTPPTPSAPSQPSQPQTPSKPAAPANGSSVTVKKSATNFSRDGGNGTRMQSWVPGSTFTVYQVSGSEVLIGRNGQYTGWVKLSDIEGYAKGTKKVSKDQLALIDELGEELVLHAGKDGKLQFLSKGSSVVPSDITDNLMKLGSLDPTDVLDRNKPKIGAPYIVNNSMEINMNIAEVVHIDNADNRSIPDITKAVQSQMDAYMKNINNSLKRFTR